VTLELNTLGDPETRDAWRAALVEYFQAHRAGLSEDSQARLERNPLRILDSKDPADRAICADAPNVDQYLTGEAADFFAAVTAGVDAAGVPWTRNARLVRGLDYYRHTAFEFVTDRLGAQGTVIAGGRYDGLIETLGGPQTPAVGWAAGIERLAMMIEAPSAETLDVVIVVDDDRARTAGGRALAHLRARGLASDIVATGSPRKRFDRAVKRGANEILVLSVGDDRITMRVKTSGAARVEAELASLDWPRPDPA